MDQEACLKDAEIEKVSPEKLTGFGRRLRELRKSQGFTVVELASRLGTHKNTIGNWEFERTKPSDQNILDLCNVLNTTRGYLLNGEDTAPHVDKVVVDLKGEVNKIAEKELKAVLKNAIEEEDVRRLTNQIPRKYSKKDKMILEDLTTIINHLPDLNLSIECKKSLYLTVSELRNEYESRYLFGSDVKEER